MDEFHAQIMHNHPQTMQKRVLAIHDISCFGKCSLTVVLPIISAMGIETTVIPTAVLSTHTGGFTGYTFRDLTADIAPIAAHFASLSLHFDAIYTGYLGSIAQVSIVRELIDALASEDTLVIVDPVMADHGALYASFPPEFPAHMRELCQRADVIVPNMTEAALLIGDNCLAEPHNRADIQRVLTKLAQLGPKRVVLTGVCLNDTQIGAAVYDVASESTSSAFTYAARERIPGAYHGTGDIFAGVLTGALMRGQSMESAAQTAVDFTVNSIIRTRDAGTDERNGVSFEAGLSELMGRYA